MKNRRVVVTGLGAITSVGQTVADFWRGLCQGRSGIRPLDLTNAVAPLRFTNGAQVEAYDAAQHFDDKHAEHLDRFAQFGLVAAREALKDARLELSREVKERACIVTGSSLGGKIAEDQTYADMYAETPKRAHPLTIPRGMSNAAASHISMEFGIVGPAYNVSTACASSGHAIGQALMLVRAGLADVAVTGGCESPFAYGHLKMWEPLRVVSPDTCRPFSKDRRGMILGEGGAMLIFETLDAARARGARIHAEVAGFGMSADAYHLTQPSAEGAARAMRAALADAGIEPSRVGYINAHGTATQANDPMETEAIHSVFGRHAERLAVSSTKSMHGHTLGAAGAIEAVASVLALRERTLPPTMNFREPDPSCNLDVVPNEARRAEVEYAMSNSFAFGGLNAVLLFRRWEEGEEVDSSQ